MTRQMMIFHYITTAVSEKLVWNSISTQAKKGRLSKEKFKEYMGALFFQMDTFDGVPPAEREQRVL